MERLTNINEEIKTLQPENEVYWLKAYFKLKEYEDAEEQLEKVYGEHDGLLETVVKSLVKYNGEKPRKARLLTDEDADKWEVYKNLEEQGLLIRLPCEVGSTVYVITTCKDFEKVLDGTLWGEGGGFGTATGYYCPYELNNSCPHEDDFDECEGGCECFENKLGVFEDCIECISVYEDKTVVFLINCGSFSFEDFGKTVFLTREEAEKALEEMEG